MEEGWNSLMQINIFITSAKPAGTNLGNPSRTESSLSKLQCCAAAKLD